MVGTGNEYKMKPGQQLYIVNRLYPYTIQFKYGSTGNHGVPKRPRDSTLEDRESQLEAPKTKASKQTEKVAVSGSHTEAKKTTVREKCLSVIITICGLSMDISFNTIQSFNTVYTK